MTSSTAFRVAAILGFLGVGIGAFGAHGLQARLEALDTVKTFGTASLYHLVHAVVLLAISREYPKFRAAWWSFFFGLLIFSGSLYVLSVSGMRWLGAVTPVGGLGFLAGWALLAFPKNAGQKEP